VGVAQNEVRVVGLLDVHGDEVHFVPFRAVMSAPWVQDDVQ
jgi:hypothetical protein